MHGRVPLLLVEYPVSALPHARYSKHTIELRSRVLTKSAHGRAPLLLVCIVNTRYQTDIACLVSKHTVEKSSRVLSRRTRESARLSHVHDNEYAGGVRSQAKS